MNNGMNDATIESLFALQDALLLKDWDKESTVINHINNNIQTKAISAAEVGELITLTSRQIKRNYPVRCFVD